MTRYEIEARLAGAFIIVVGAVGMWNWGWAWALGTFVGCAFGVGIMLGITAIARRMAP